MLKLCRKIVPITHTITPCVLRTRRTRDRSRRRKPRSRSRGSGRPVKAHVRFFATAFLSRNIVIIFIIAIIVLIIILNVYCAAAGETIEVRMRPPWEDDTATGVTHARAVYCIETADYAVHPRYRKCIAKNLFVFRLLWCFFFSTVHLAIRLLFPLVLVLRKIRTKRSRYMRYKQKLSVVYVVIDFSFFFVLPAHFNSRLAEKMPCFPTRTTVFFLQRIEETNILVICLKRPSGNSLRYFPDRIKIVGKCKITITNLIHVFTKLLGEID